MKAIDYFLKKEYREDKKILKEFSFRIYFLLFRGAYGTNGVFNQY